MKKLFVTTVIASAIASSALSQGFVNFSGGGSAATRVSTNSVPNGPATGATLNGANGYYYALFASTTLTATSGSGTNASYVFSNLGSPSTAWELVGMGAASATLGRFSATTQGTNTAGQAPLNADNSFTVQGIAGGANGNFVAVGWSANIGTTLDALKAWYVASGNVTSTGWIGQSTMGTQTLGDGGLVSTPSWNTAPSFLLGQIVAIPEPTTLALAGLGGASLLLFRRRK